ncbi:5-oxoprolinase (ATP-hydrolysing) [Jannaschia seohaensis]|uniref:5-oxoprolinase (ATP-hydrolysing) n=1 Tax=Jannaschia seohaensis TaxID=475081 RepID=A0A2Y9BW99_9RHOB|nr:5-oxoprolinase (ATP-hydrolysing) [Jannaschia seohaensis]SSA38712.1 5-oxoprolinase (ATP-hydrolysing) [Jannaschia seohaensis]
MANAPDVPAHIDEQAVPIGNFRLLREGVLREEAARALPASGRSPCGKVDQDRADLPAQIVANVTGVAQMSRIAAPYGADVVAAYMRHVQDNAAERGRRVLDMQS